MLLSRLLGSEAPIAATAGSGTAALISVILARASRASAPRVLVSCYTFVATAAAVEQCGYQLHVIDIDETTGWLHPDKFVAHPVLPEVGLVLPVAPFGRA